MLLCGNTVWVSLGQWRAVFIVCMCTAMIRLILWSTVWYLRINVNVV